MSQRQSIVRLYWAQNVDFACLSAVAATKKFTIAGDKRRQFIVGTPFTKTGTGTGAFVVDAVEFNGTNTVITVSESVTDSTNNGLLRLAYNFMEWTNGGGSWAWCFPDDPSNPRMEDTDRYERKHILIPPGTYQPLSYFTGVQIQVKGQMCLALAADGDPFPDVVYDRMVVASTLFTILHEEELWANDGAYNKRLAYRGFVSKWPAVLGSLRTANGRNDFDMKFTLAGSGGTAGDGTFSLLGDPAAVTWRSI